MKLEIKYGKEILKLELPGTATLGDLKSELAKRTSVPTNVQVLTGKPNLKDNTVKLGAGGLGWNENGLHRLMMIGTPVTTLTQATEKETKAETAKRERKFRQFQAPFSCLPPTAGLLADAFSEGKVEGGTGDLALLVMDLLLGRVSRLGVSPGLVQQLESGPDTGVPIQKDGFHELLMPSATDSTTATSTDAAPASSSAAAAAASSSSSVEATNNNNNNRNINHKEAAALVKTHSVVRRAIDIAQTMYSATKPEQVIELITEITSRINALPKNEWLLVPFGFVGMKSRSTMYLLLTPEGNGDRFTVVFCNRGAGMYTYHPSIVTKKEILGKAVIRINGVLKNRIADKGFWVMALSQIMKQNDPQVVSEYNRVEVVFDVLLPWLVENQGSAMDFGKLTQMFTQNDEGFTSPALAEITAAAPASASTNPILAALLQQQQQDAAPASTPSSPTKDDKTSSSSSPSFPNELIKQNYDSPALSESSAILALNSAVNFLLRQFGMTSENMIERTNLCLQLEAARRASEELIIDAKKWLPSNNNNDKNQSTPPTSVPGIQDLPAFERSIKRLTNCEGVEPNETNLTLQMLFDAISPEYIKGSDGKALSPHHFEGRAVAVYYGGSWCGPCRKFKPLLLDAVKRIKDRIAAARGRGNFFELIYISLDRSPQEFAEYSKDAPWCFLAPHEKATKAAAEAFDVTGVPQLFLFAPDGNLLTRDGVRALREDPDASKFPNAPWTGARKLLQTDSHMLRYICHGLAHTTSKLLDQGSELLTLAQAKKIDDLLSAIRDLTARMPTVPLDASVENDKDHEAEAAAKKKKALAATAAAPVKEDAATTVANTNTNNNNNNNNYDPIFGGWPLMDKLNNRNVDGYVGRRFKTELPELGMMSGFTPAKTLKELHSLLTRANRAVIAMWNRAKTSGTSSRVALQMNIIEFICHVFLRCVPPPLPPSTSASSSNNNSSCPYTKNFTEEVGTSSNNAAAPAPTPAGGAAAPSSSDEDPQLQMLSAINNMLLSLTTAWQAIEVPTRAYDSERALTAMAIQCCFDALLRNKNGAKQCSIISSMMAEDGGYHLSTKICRRAIEFEQLSEHFELVRPWMLPVRSKIIEYVQGSKKANKQELFDYPMPDKIELRKHSSTLMFMRSFCERCQIPIMPRRDQMGMFAPSNEMEALMMLFTDSKGRTPLGRSHMEFIWLRDVVLLSRFLMTMEMRESQLLSKRKQQEEFTSWRLAFDEDGPGKQMSAGWRSRPTPPTWEAVMVRGRDMDIADIVVRGFGDREIEWGEGLTVQSPIDVGARIGAEYPTEDDVLHAKNLPTFGDVTTSEESELLLSYLTVPYLRIPLILEFFSTQDRHTYLLSTELQALLRAALFEPGSFVSSSVLAEEKQRSLDDISVPLRLSSRQRQDVTMAQFANVKTKKRDTTLLLGTSEGLLLNELCNQRPQTVLIPLQHFLETVKELGPSSVYSSNAAYVLFLVSIITDVLTFVRFVLDTNRATSADTLKEHETALIKSLTEVTLPLIQRWGTEAVESDDTTTFCVIQAHRALIHRIQLDTQPLPSASASASSSSTAELQFHAAAFLSACSVVRARHGFGLGMLRTQLAKSQQDANLSPEERLIRFLQAQGLDTAQVSAEQLERGRKLMQSGGRRRALFVQIRTRFYSDTVRIPNLMRVDADSAASAKSLQLPPVDMPEHMLFAMLQDEEQRILALVEHANLEVLRTRLLDTIVRNVIHRKGDAATATAATSSTSTSSSGGSAAIKWDKLQPGIYKSTEGSGLVVSLTTCETFWRNDELRPVPDTMTHFPDYESVLGKDARQCGLVQRSENRHWVHVVGTPYDLAEWTPHDPTDQGEGAPKGNPETFHFNGVFFNRKLDLDDEAPWPVIGERWAVNAVLDVIKTAYPQPGQFKAKLILPDRGDDSNNSADGTSNSEDVPYLRVMYNDLHQYVEEEDQDEGGGEGNDDDADHTTPPGRGRGGRGAAAGAARGRGGRGGAGGRGRGQPMTAQEEEDRNRQTWKEILVTRLAGTKQPFVRVFNIVPFARRCFRVLVYASNAQLSQHGMAPLLSSRVADTLDLLKFHAGELKRRVQHETTLEIHRFNAAVGGREAYVPPRLLQGLLPSVILEAFMFWLGTDDVLRGESTNSADQTDSWFNYKLEVYLPKSFDQEALVIRRPQSCEFTPIDASKIRRSSNNKSPHRSSNRSNRALANNRSPTKSGLGNRQPTATDLLTMNRTTSAEDTTTMSSSAQQGEQRKQVSDLNLTLLQSVFPSLKFDFCRFILEEANDSLSAATSLIEDEAAFGECIDRWEAVRNNNNNTNSTQQSQEESSSANNNNNNDDANSSSLPRQKSIEERTNSDNTEGMMSQQRQSSMIRSESFVDTTDDASIGASHLGSGTATKSDELILFNGVDSNKLAKLTTQLTSKLEDASHMLIWGRSPRPLSAFKPTAENASGQVKKTAEEVWKFILGNDKDGDAETKKETAGSSDAALVPATKKPTSKLSSLSVNVIELPRLRVRFIPGLGPNEEAIQQQQHQSSDNASSSPSTTNSYRYLHLADATAWWMSQVTLPDFSSSAEEDQEEDEDNTNDKKKNESSPATIDYSGIPSELIRMVRRLASPFGGQFILLRNAAKELQLMVPNHEIHPLGVKGDPFRLFVLPDRGSLTWQESVNTPYYMYGVHTSATFLLPPTLASALYLVVSLLARRQYSLALRYAEGCYVDTNFTVEERFMFALANRTVEDRHPDAHAVRLKLAHTVLMSDNKVPWELHTEVSKYLGKLTFVSSDCRLSAEETIDVMKRCERANPLIKAQLQYWHHASRHEHETGETTLKVDPPHPKICGQPWGKLLMMNRDTVMQTAIRPKRLHYQLPKTLPFAETDLIASLWDDELLTDEESGTNRQLGWGFLFELCSKRRGILPITIAGADVSSSITELLLRHFHLKHSRWGRESTEDGETEYSQSYGMSMLATTLLDPTANFPQWDTRDMRAALMEGCNLNGPEARECGLYEWWQRCEHQMNRAHGSEGTMPSLAQQVRTNQKNVNTIEKARVRAIPELSVSPEERKALRSHGRPFPSNTAQASITLPIGKSNDDPICRSLCFVPLASAEWSEFVSAEEPAKSTNNNNNQQDSNGKQQSLLPFPHLEEHPAAKTHIAQDLLRRLEEDMETFHGQQQSTKKLSFKVSDTKVNFRNLFLSGSNSGEDSSSNESSVNTQLLEGFHKTLIGLYHRLALLAESDQQHVASGVAKALKLANTEHVSEESAVKENSEMNIRSRLSKHERKVRAVTFEWLCGAVLSTEFDKDVHRANPSHGNVETMTLMLVSTMLRANRVRFAQLAMQQIASLVSFARTCLARVQQLSSSAENNNNNSEIINGGAHADALVNKDTMSGRFDLLCSQLLETLTASRQYAHVDEAASTVTIDPRFLIFEFLFAILLRPRQVEMVEWFVKSVRDEGVSRVQQMLMGQGKTTVVGPLLALILADQKTLVTQVTPTALIDQTRNVLRRCFSVVVPKKILTLEFDRTWGGGSESGPANMSLGKIEMLVQKLNSARRSGAIVVSAPECIKALQLKIVEMLHTVEEATVPAAEGSEDVHGGISEILYDLKRAAAGKVNQREMEELQHLKKRLISRSKTADSLVPIIADLWKSNGVMIMDESDILLSALKSELNFPIGHRHPLDGSGPRWTLPIHLIDIVLACTRTGRATSSLFNDRDAICTEALTKAATAIQSGFARQALQREPHLVLLDVSFYHDTLAPALLPWLMLWIRKNVGLTALNEDSNHGSNNNSAAPSKQKLLKPEEESTIAQFVLCSDAPSAALANKIHQLFAPAHVQLLNLARQWMITILPHVLSKISRVGFGLLQPEDERTLRTISANAEPPTVSRRLLAVPFVAKDVPSRSSEFAHPDVVIGLSIFAFRYEGLRKSDVRDVVSQLQEDCSRQHGPRERRPAAVLYNKWMSLAMEQRRIHEAFKKSHSAAELAVNDHQLSMPNSPTSPNTSTSAAGFPGTAASTTSTSHHHHGNQAQNHQKTAEQQLEDMMVIPLGQLHVADPVQLEGLHNALSRVPEVAHHHLTQHVFPRTMLFQQLKVSACGHELGSSILFKSRIGFSGTPGNLLPADLGNCSYEPGSDGRILTVLSSPEVTTSEVLSSDWSPRGVLEKIATSEPPAHALIDVGALITNMDNEQVARFLMERLPEDRFDAVVFLDSQDRHVALLRANRLVLPIAQCGVPLSRRFTFFDQIHTTGTDVKQAPSARAVVTVGKDTVFRDYAQGAYRMRGIGKGQKIHVYVIPEVSGRIQEMLGKRFATGKAQVDIPAWLLLNTMRMEALQFLKLSEQEIANVFRKRALDVLLEDCKKRGDAGTAATDWSNCLRFVDQDQAPKAQTSSNPHNSPAVARKLGCAIRIFREALGFPLQSRVEPNQSIQQILQAKVDDLCARCADSGIVLTPQDLERLQLVLSRLNAPTTQQDEQPTSEDGAPSDKDKDGDHKTVENENKLVAAAATAGLNTEVVHEQEQEQEQEQEAEQEEQRESAYSRDDEQPISWTAATISLDRSSVNDAVKNREDGMPFYGFNKFRIRQQQPLLDGLGDNIQLTDNLFRPRWFGAGDRRLKNVIVFVQLVSSASQEGETSNNKNTTTVTNDSTTEVTTTTSTKDDDASKTDEQQVAASTSTSTSILASKQEKNRFVAVSLAEAESLRWLVHRSQICNSSSSFALRATMSNAIIDATDVFSSISPAPTKESALSASLFYRFFNNDMFFSDEEIALMESSVFNNLQDRSIRIGFFEETLRLRRRHRNQWDDAPVAKLLVSSSSSTNKDDDDAATSPDTNNNNSIQASVANADSVAAKAAVRRLVGVFERNPTAQESLSKSSSRIFRQTRALPVMSVATLLSHAISRGRAIFPAHVIASLLRPHADVVSLMITEKGVSEAISTVASVANADAAVDQEKKKETTVAQEAAAVAQEFQTWTCGACTYINMPSSFECEICQTPRPGVSRPTERLPEAPDGYWSCSVERGGCSKFNRNELFYCEVCDKARPDLASVRF